MSDLDDKLFALQQQYESEVHKQQSIFEETLMELARQYEKDKKRLHREVIDVERSYAPPVFRHPAITAMAQQAVSTLNPDGTITIRIAADEPYIPPEKDEDKPRVIGMYETAFDWDFDNE